MTSTPVPPNKRKTSGRLSSLDRKVSKPSGNVYRNKAKKPVSKDAAGRSPRRFFLPLFIVWLVVVATLAGLIYWGLRESSKPAVPPTAAASRTGQQKREASAAVQPSPARSDLPHKNAVRTQPSQATAPQKPQAAPPPTSIPPVPARPEIAAPPPHQDAVRASRPSSSQSQPNTSAPEATQAPPAPESTQQAASAAPKAALQSPGPRDAKRKDPSADSLGVPSVPPKQSPPPVQEKENQNRPPEPLLALNTPAPSKPKIPLSPDLTTPSLGRVAIVIDDLGQDLSAARRLMEIPLPITFSVLPFLSHSLETARMAAAGGREVIIHIPMEPKEYPKANPGTGALLLSMSSGEIRQKLTNILNSNPYADGVNNHMGSSFTERREAMELVLSELKHRKLFFLDSFTSPSSVGYSLANRMNVPAGKRDIFLDHVITEQSVRSQLEQLIRKARIQGTAIAIGHPHECTLRVLSKAAPRLQQQGITVVPLNSLVNGSF